MNIWYECIACCSKAKLIAIVQILTDSEVIAFVANYYCYSCYCSCCMVKRNGQMETVDFVLAAKHLLVAVATAAVVV